MRYNILKDGKKSFNHLDSSVGEFVYLMLENLILMVLSVMVGLGVPQTATVSTVFQFLIEMGFLATVFIAARASRTAVLPATGLNKPISLKTAGIVLVIAVIAMFGLSPLTNSFLTFLESLGYQSKSSSLVINTWGKYILGVLTMAIVPAFCEEMLFRGLVYRGLTKWNKTGAVFVSAAFFMLMHGSPDQTVHQFLLGIILALLFAATGSIWAPMLLHFLNNFISLTMTFVYYKKGLLTVGESTESVATKVPWGTQALYFLFALFMTALVGYLIWQLLRAIQFMKKRDEEQKMQKLQIGKENDFPKISDDVSQGSASMSASEKPQQSAPEVEQNLNVTVAQEGEEVASDEFVSDKNSKLSIVLFSLSAIWLVFDWVVALIRGFM